jgi:hypothetical protein
VEAHGVEAGQRRRGARQQGALGRVGHGQPGGAAGQGDQQALDEELPEQPPPARPEGCAHGDLLAALEPPGEGGARQVRAGDEEEQAGGAQEEQERTPDRAGDGFEEGRDSGADRQVVGGAGLVTQVARQDALRDGGQLRLGLRGADAVAQAADQPPVVGRAVLVEGHELLGEPDLRVIGVGEARREHPHHPQGEAPGLERAPLDRSAPQDVAPEALAHHRHRSGARPVLLGRRQPAQRRAHAEGAEEALRDRRRPGEDRVVAPEHRRGGAGVGGQGLEAVGQVVPVPERGVGRAHGAAGGVDLLRSHQAVGLGVGQAREHHAVDHAEGGGVGAHAQGQGEDRQHREAGPLDEGAARGLHVVPQGVEGHALEYGPGPSSVTDSARSRPRFRSPRQNEGGTRMKFPSADPEPRPVDLVSP